MGSNFSNSSFSEKEECSSEERKILKYKKNDKEDNKEGTDKKKKKGRKKKKIDSPPKKVEFPDPETLDNTALSLEMKRYGMKPQNKKNNIEILKSVYNFFKIKELPENILHSLTSFDIDSNNNIGNDKEIESKENVTNKKEISNEQKLKIIETIKDCKTIYEKILLFKEVSLKEIKVLLNSKGIIVPNHLLSKLLIDSGVVLPGGWNNKK